MRRKKSRQRISVSNLPIAFSIVVGMLLMTLLTVRQVQYTTNLRPKALDVHATPTPTPRPTPPPTLQPAPGATCSQQSSQTCTTSTGLRGSRTCTFTRRNYSYPYACDQSPINCTACVSTATPRPTASPTPGPYASCYRVGGRSCRTSTGASGSQTCTFTKRASTSPYTCNQGAINCTVCTPVYTPRPTATPYPAAYGSCFEKGQRSCTLSNGSRGLQECTFTRRGFFYPFICNESPISCSPCGVLPTPRPYQTPTPRPSTVPYPTPNPAISSLVNVDKSRPLTREQVAAIEAAQLMDLSGTTPGRYVISVNPRIHKASYSNFSHMMEAAWRSGVSLYVRSTFRSYSDQATAAGNSPDPSAALPPGTSQHQTGLALDFSTPENNHAIGTTSGFKDTTASKWLANNAAAFGYVQTYTHGHDGVPNEEWHYMYVGPQVSQGFAAKKAQGWDGDIFDYLDLIQ